MIYVLFYSYNNKYYAFGVRGKLLLSLSIYKNHQLLQSHVDGKENILMSLSTCLRVVVVI